LKNDFLKFLENEPPERLSIGCIIKAVYSLICTLK